MTVVMTHAGGGVGLGLARFWASRGADVVIAKGPLRSRIEAEHFVRKARDGFGPLKAVICAPPSELPWDFDRDFWEAVYLSFATLDAIADQSSTCELIHIVTGGRNQ